MWLELCPDTDHGLELAENTAGRKLVNPVPDHGLEHGNNGFFDSVADHGLEHGNNGFFDGLEKCKK